MGLKSILLAGAVVATSIWAPAQAAVVDPTTGGVYEFGWTDGLGQIDYIIDDVGTDWTLDLVTGGIWSFSVQDLYVAGDEFTLNVFGFDLPWDSTFISPDGYFNGTISGYLAAGSYTATLFVTALAPGFNNGEARATILPGAVPLPASLPLLLAGLGGIAVLRRRKAA